MEGYNKTAIWIIALIMSWLEAVPYYGGVYRTLIERSQLSYDTAQTVFIVFYFSFVVVFSLIIREQRVKKMTYTGVAACFTLVMAGWLWPVSQMMYILHAFLGIAAALISIVFCYVFIYSFSPSTRVRATAGFEVVTCICGLLVNFILLKINSNLAFTFTCLVLLSILLLNSRFDPSSMTSPTTIEKRPVPVKLIAAAGTVIFILYVNSGFEYNVLNEMYKRINVETPGFGIEIMILQIVTYTVIYFMGSRVSKFGLVYVTLAAMGLANLFGAILPGQVFVAVTFIYIATCAGNIFVFVIMGDISLKYGRNFRTAGISLFACGMGAISGEFFGKWTIRMTIERTALAFTISMFTVFISFLIIPWLIKSINDELQSIIEDSCQDSKQTSMEEVKNDEQIPYQQHPQPGVLSSSEQKLQYACATLLEGNYLTPREFEIAELLLERLDNETIANRLFISQNTLKVHIRRIYQKFQVSRKKQFIDMVDSICIEMMKV